MRSHVRLRLAEAIRTGLDEFAERWVKFVRANDLAPDTDEPADDIVNRASLGFEVLANLLEGADYSKFENVVRRLLHDWINKAGSFTELLDIEDAFPRFMMPHLEIESDSDEEEEFISELDEFFHSDIRPRVLAQYLQTYEEIIGAESSHTAYVLAHFDAILSLSAHLNGAETRDDILSGLPSQIRNLFENVYGLAIWIETDDGLAPTAVDILGDEVPPIMLSGPLPVRIEEAFNIGEVRWIPEDQLPGDFVSLIDVDTGGVINGCVIPIRPRETEGILILLAVGSDTPGALELSLSRVAAAECTLALERTSGQARISNFNRRISDILTLSRETAWGAGHHETAELVVDHLLHLTGGRRAMLLVATSPEFSAEPSTPIAWRDLSDDEINSWRLASGLPPIVSIALKSGNILLLTAERLGKVLAGRKPPVGFNPSENEALGILPLERKGARQGVCLFLCPGRFAIETESADILAVFARTVADSLATAKEYENTLRMAGIIEEDAARARILQRQLTPRYARSGNLIYWAHLQPAGELAGDVLVVRKPRDGSLNVWVADVAGRGPSAGWSMMYIRQLLADLPHDTSNPRDALAGINAKLHDIELKTSPGIYTTLIGLHLDESQKRAGFSRAGAPRLIRVTSDGAVECVDPDGLPLGLFPDAQLEEATVPFNPGDKLVWASDGLLGIRDDSGERWSESGLTGCVRNAYHLPARALYERILSTVGEFSADDHVRDDWSLVVIGHDPPPDWVGKRTGRERRSLLDEALDWLREKEITERDFNAMRSLLDEAIKNAHEHGNRLDDDASIEVKITLSPRSIHIQIRDEGGRLNERFTSPNLPPGRILEDKGRGFLLMRHQCDHLWVDADLGELNAVRLLEVDP